MGWRDPAVDVPRVTYRRLQMLVEEVSYLADGEGLASWELREQVEQLIGRILDEYVRQHFEESTKAAAQLLTARRRESLK
ncbi:hypothetical protein [Alicyclobacillus sp. ALC3]|uniref:hypothetical protein n=1 Tax=Alicyclobacillus sp. ALC3 TaxID=2796143 RepID=UPI002378ADD0|nr:hypothetical protein [Alicyclobacillus sp. ALC3]WDL96968.1 hypothetical protein JC200_22260 [Alicyclobacillus sp. ALC3]